MNFSKVGPLVSCWVNIIVGLTMLTEGMLFLIKKVEEDCDCGKVSLVSVSIDPPVPVGEQEERSRESD